MNRFLIFAGDNYYPCGGMEDFHGSCNTMNACMRALQGHRYEWWNILDTCTGRVYHSREVVGDALEWADGIDSPGDVGAGV